jgi:transformation/transcription domain-associated protein
MYALFNRLMSKYKETRRRNLVFHIPVSVPITNRMRFYKADESLVSLEEVYEQQCALRGTDPDAPLLEHRAAMKRHGNKLIPAMGADGQQVGTEAANLIRQRVYEHICTEVVPDYLFR